MPNDTLRETVEEIRRGALSYIASNRPDAQHRRQLLKDIQSGKSRLSAEIEERNTTYLDQLDAKEAAAIDARRTEVYQNPKFQRASEAQRANHQRFESLRQVNDGGYPKNISPVLYVIPLILIGVAEWYVNFSTFAAMFIPVFAISATIIVAAVFAWASHLHGAYLKQISEILHPSLEYRNILGRKIALVMATILLLAALATVVWLRWLVIAEQLGMNAGTTAGTFGGATTTTVWSKVGPTIVLNLLIWGLGTLYSWALHEKIPGLRESYRDYLHASRRVDRKLRPFFAEERRLKAQYGRERDKNNVAVNEYKALLEDLSSAAERIQESEHT